MSMSKSMDVMTMKCFFVKIYSSRKSDNSFYFDPPNNISYGGGGTTPDPYKTKLLKVGKSQEPNTVRAPL